MTRLIAVSNIWKQSHPAWVLVQHTLPWLSQTRVCDHHQELVSGTPHGSNATLWLNADSQWGVASAAILRMDICLGQGDIDDCTGLLIDLPNDVSFLVRKSAVDILPPLHTVWVEVSAATYFSCAAHDDVS